jgi:REP element-mobilizing transposase RayT
VRSAIVGFVRDQLVVSDVALLAYAIMPNHLHLVVRQGSEPMHRFVQPIVRRTALLVQRVHGRIGHVFERRYRDTPCADPEHLRNAIVYTHLNPVRAGLCRDAAEYVWTSHAAWAGAVQACDGKKDPSSAHLGLELFASNARRGAEGLVKDYLAYLRWRVEFDAYRARLENDERDGARSPDPPPIGSGDAAWLHLMTPRPPAIGAGIQQPSLPKSGGPVRADLAAIALRALTDSGSDLELSILRSRWGGPCYVEARRRFIRNAAAAGYKGVQIAAYLHITAGAVSRVLSKDRRLLIDAAA